MEEETVNKSAASLVPRRKLINKVRRKMRKQN